VLLLIKSFYEFASYDVDHSRVVSISNLPSQPDVDTSKVRVIDAILSTSAAPTYFPMCSWNLMVKGVEQQFNCVDGGIWSNDPSLYSLIMRRYIDQDPNKVHNVICFGTGIYIKETHSTSEWYSTVGWLAGSPNLIDVILNASSSMIETMMNSFTLLKMARYIKCQVNLTQNIKLDDLTSMRRQEQEVENMDKTNIDDSVTRTLYMGTNVRNIINCKKTMAQLPEEFRNNLDRECLEYLKNISPNAVKFYLPEFPDYIQKEFRALYSPEVLKNYGV